MIINIFSSFDPAWFNICYKNLTIIIILPSLFLRIYWLNNNKIIINIFPVISYILLQFIKTKLKIIKGLSLTIRSLFIFILYINLSGMFPYSFNVTSHIIFTISIGLPIWIICVIRRYNYSNKKTISHLLPEGAPTWLNPFLVLIESTRISVRPLTLSFRLIANITAGHVVLTLISSFSIKPVIKTFWITLPVSSIYIIFELTICIIQAYIFCLLISLYINDHS